MITTFNLIPVRTTLSNFLRTYHLIGKPQNIYDIYDITKNSTTSLSFIMGFENITSQNAPFTVTGGIITNWISPYRIYITCSINEEIPTISNIYPSGLFAEREIFDLLGIIFKGSTDLRRILTDYGFKQHPLRKIVPSIGWIETIYSPSNCSLISRPIS
jgi:NADH:ubiquinone oxidoreductase subunit C